MKLESYLKYIKKELQTKHVTHTEIQDEVETDVSVFESFTFVYDEKSIGYLISGNFNNVYIKDYDEMSLDSALLYFIGRKYISFYLDIHSEYEILSRNDFNNSGLENINLKENLLVEIDEFKHLGLEDISNIKIYEYTHNHKKYFHVVDLEGFYMNIPQDNVSLTLEDALAMHYGVELRFINEHYR